MPGPDSLHGSVTVWLQRLKAGDAGEAVARLWASYFGRLVGLDAASLARGDVIQGATNAAVASSEAAVRDVRFGNVLLPTAPVLVADLPVFELFGVADEPAVIFGMDWLTSARLVVDFPLRRLWFHELGD